ncbi:MAG: ribonuclease HIII, partial [Deltaproteobacteria bacterium]|nr:ribonuclease HIII [Deltaproteobacteria bacterium]
KHISIVAPSNSKYNELYEKFKNLNRFLAWGHARVIENLISVWSKEKGHALDGAVSDQFGSETYIRNALSSMKHFNLIQRPRAESNTAVAAASILARNTFEKKIERLNEEYGVTLPFGAGPQVITAAKKFTERHGREKLKEIAKLHFKTVQQV